MAEDGPFEALRATEEQTAEQITKQTQGATENYFGWLQKSMSALPWTNTNLIEYFWATRPKTLPLPLRSCKNSAKRKISKTSLEFRLSL
jgi:hypothetical protein